MGRKSNLTYKAVNSRGRIDEPWVLDSEWDELCQRDSALFEARWRSRPMVASVYGLEDSLSPTIDGFWKDRLLRKQEQEQAEKKKGPRLKPYMEMTCIPGITIYHGKKVTSWNVRCRNRWGTPSYKRFPDFCEAVKFKSLLKQTIESWKK